MTRFSYSGSILEIEGNKYNLEYPIDDAILVNDIIVVLYNPDSFVQKFGQFKNLIALTLQGKKLWVAELPTTMTGECYTCLDSSDPLLAQTFGTYRCEIDPSNGKIVNTEFFK